MRQILIIAAVTCSLGAQGSSARQVETTGAEVAAAPAATPTPLPAGIVSDLPRTASPSHYAIAFTPDAAAGTFTGSETIDLTVFAPSDGLTLNAAALTIGTAQLARADGAGAPVTLTPALGAAGQTVRLQAASGIAPGRYALRITYAGRINSQANGLFALDYPDKRSGRTVRALFTQFEPGDARRFAPMFDEPSYKATFALIATVPANLMAISNMPVAGERALPGGLKQVTFGTTARMSSYLLFFALGDFERSMRPAADGIEAGIVAPAGSGDQARYALDALAGVIGYYDDYFGVRYPLPKLDNIAAPGQSQFFSAMENWGAILTFEKALLLDPASASTARRQLIFSDQAHEAAHQWFGDLVTMGWWDDIWLNEGFASWMQTKATDHFNPQWHALLGRIDGREKAMALDALATTHPIVQPVRSVAEVNQAFDSIAYNKGEAVIAMLEAYVGEDAWRAGIRRYMAAHAFGNTSSDDLWRAIDAGGAGGITDIAHDFTRQPGVPLIRAEATCTGGQTMLHLHQGRFDADRADARSQPVPRWRVPLLIAAGGAAPVREVLDGDARVTLPGCGAVVVNGGQLGYARTLYSPDLAAKLVTAMPALAPIDQLGLMRDGLALARADDQPLAGALDLLAAIPTDADPVVAAGALEQWRGLASLADGDRLGATVRARWSPRLAQLGLEPRADEPLIDGALRAALIETLGTFDDPAIVAQAHARLARLAQDPRSLDGPLKDTWLAIAARNATPAEWTQIAALARGSARTVERETYLVSLGQAADPALSAKALDMAISGDVGTAGAAMIKEVATLHPDQALAFAMANRTRVDPLIDLSAASDYLARLAQTSRDPAMLGRLATLRESMPADARKAVDAVVAGLRQRLATEPRLRRQMAAWLAARG